MATAHKPHPFALLFPPMTEREYAELKNSIFENGLIDPITLANDMILDGIHRERACIELNVPARYIAISGTETKLLDYVVAKNLPRRHLSSAQRAQVAADLANMRKGNFSKSANLQISPVTQATAARLFDVSERSVADAVKVKNHGTPELVQAVKEDKIAVSTAAAIADAPRREQKNIVALNDEREIVKRANEIKARKKAERAETRRNELIAKADAFTLEGPSQTLDAVTIHNLDARQMLDVLTPGAAQLVITSPPYNCGIDYAGYNDNLPWDEYRDLLASVFLRCYEALCDGGRIAVVVPLGMDRAPWTPFAPRIHKILSECGFTSRGWIVWNKGNVQNSTAWGSFRSFTNPALRDACEVIIVMHKGSDTLAAPDNALVSDAKGKYAPHLRDPNYFAELTQNEWNVAPETRLNGSHPAPFPVLLAQRLMHLYAPAGALVVDPFAGSGTVGVAAIKNGYRAALFEISAVYCALARERIEANQ